MSNDQLGGRPGRLVEFLCGRFQQVAARAGQPLRAVLDRDETAPQLDLVQRHALVEAEAQIQLLDAMCDQYAPSPEGAAPRH